MIIGITVWILVFVFGSCYCNVGLARNLRFQWGSPYSSVKPEIPVRILESWFYSMSSGILVLTILVWILVFHWKFWHYIENGWWESCERYVKMLCKCCGNTAEIVSTSFETHSIFYGDSVMWQSSENCERIQCEFGGNPVWVMWQTIHYESCKNSIRVMWEFSRNFVWILYSKLWVATPWGSWASLWWVAKKINIWI